MRLCVIRYRNFSYFATLINTLSMWNIRLLAFSIPKDLRSDRLRLPVYFLLKEFAKLLPRLLSAINRTCCKLFPKRTLAGEQWRSSPLVGD